MDPRAMSVVSVYWTNLPFDAFCGTLSDDNLNLPVSPHRLYILFPWPVEALKCYQVGTGLSVTHSVILSILISCP